MKTNLELQAERNLAARLRLAEQAPSEGRRTTRPPAPRPDDPDPAVPGGCWCGAPPKGHPRYTPTQTYTARHKRLDPGKPHCPDALTASAELSRDKYWRNKQ